MANDSLSYDTLTFEISGRFGKCYTTIDQGIKISSTLFKGENIIWIGGLHSFRP